MNFIKKIEKALTDETSQEFLYQQLDNIRNNILETEKRISKHSIIILILIAIAELIKLNIITEINLLSTKLNTTGIGLSLIIMPCLIAYYTYALYNQIVLRGLLNKLYFKIIKSKYPLISELDIDYLLITHLDSNTEDILTSGKQNWLSMLITTLTAPFLLIFQYLPIAYASFLFYYMFNNKTYVDSQLLIWISLIIAAVFFIRGFLLFAAYIHQQGGIIAVVEELLAKIGIKKPL